VSIQDSERPKDVTPLALRLCGQWLATCLELGWSQRELDDLERLWWKYRDRHGNLKSQFGEK
jgi:hypothetical protein